MLPAHRCSVSPWMTGGETHHQSCPPVPLTGPVFCSGLALFSSLFFMICFILFFTLWGNFFLSQKNPFHLTWLMLLHPFYTFVKLYCFLCCLILSLTLLSGGVSKKKKIQQHWYFCLAFRLFCVFYFLMSFHFLLSFATKTTKM